MSTATRAIAMPSRSCNNAAAGRRLKLARHQPTPTLSTWCLSPKPYFPTPHSSQPKSYLTILMSRSRQSTLLPS